MSAKGVPAKRMTGGKNSSIEGPTKPPPDPSPEAKSDAVRIVASRMYSRRGALRAALGREKPS